MTLQRLEEVVAICKNKECPDYQSFEKYDAGDVADLEGKDIVICTGCKQNIYID